MADDTEPTRASIIESTSPAELFGPEAVSLPRALKSSYAKLIRRFGPDHDPEAFEHIRSLYERARHAPVAPQGDAPEVPSDPDSTGPYEARAPSSEPSSPPQALSRALDREDWDVVEHHVDEAPGPVIEADADLWLEAAWALTEARLFETPAARLRARLDALEWVAHAVELPILLEVEELILTGLAFLEAGEDPHVLDDLLSAIRRAWTGDVVAAAQIWREAGPELASASDLDAQVRGLELHHPLVHRCLTQVNARVSDAEAVHQVWMRGRIEPGPALRDRRLRRRLSPSFLATSFELQEVLRLGVLIGTLITGLVLAAMAVHALVPAASTVAYGVSCGSVCTLVFFTYWRITSDAALRPKSSWTPKLRAMVVGALREEALWPHELVGATLPAWERVPVRTDSTMLDLEQDRSLVLASMTDAHFERVRARMREEASR